MKKYFKRFAMLIGVVAIAGAAFVAAGCGRGGGGGEAEFDIPASLVDRMRVSYNLVRNKMTGGAENLDGEELMALMMLGYGNAPEIAVRPRGEMVFTDDGRSEGKRRELWPFDVAAFEATLEAELVRDEKGLYLKKDEEGGTFPFNPTMRWVNAEMEQWAIGQLDAAFTRMAPGVHAEMIGEPEEEGEEIPMWAIPGDGDEYFAIERSDGAWEARSYQYVLWDGKGKPTLFGEFYSFPSRKEAIAMRMARRDVRSLNNMSVLYWRHRVVPMHFTPEEIKEMRESHNGAAFPELRRIWWFRASTDRKRFKQDDVREWAEGKRRRTAVSSSDAEERELRTWGRLSGCWIAPRGIGAGGVSGGGWRSGDAGWCCAVGVEAEGGGV